jgi:7-cyano-7-deazaguanine synthase in queuosine biosynthesis
VLLLSSLQPAIRALLKRMPIVERKKAKVVGADEESSPLVFDADELKRKCHGCMVYKPDRVHHCAVCGQCVLRMDHRQ